LITNTHSVFKFVVVMIMTMVVMTLMMTWPQK